MTTCNAALPLGPSASAFALTVYGVSVSNGLGPSGHYGEHCHAHLRVGSALSVTRHGQGRRSDSQTTHQQVMTMRHSIVVLLLTVFPGPLVSQATTETKVVVAGSATVEVSPDFATMGLGVRVQASSPDEAAREMSVRIDAVVDTLAALGFPRDSLPARVFAVTTDLSRADGYRITGYSAAVTLEVRTTELDRLAEFVGAALAAGATEVNQVRFGSSYEAEAREEALRQAVEAAERDAQVIAEARDTQLGPLLKISTVERPNSGLRLRAASFVTASALVPQMIKVTVTVTTWWTLQGG